MTLEINRIGPFGVAGTFEEVVEADFEKCGRGGVSRNVAADAIYPLGVGAHNHGHGVPANVAADAALHFGIAGHTGLTLTRDGVAVGRGKLHGDLDAARPGAGFQFIEKEQCALGSPAFDGVVEGLHPFACLCGIDVLCCSVFTVERVIGHKQ